MLNQKKLEKIETLRRVIYPVIHPAIYILPFSKGECAYRKIFNLQTYSPFWSELGLSKGEIRLFLDKFRAVLN